MADGSGNTCRSDHIYNLIPQMSLRLDFKISTVRIVAII